MRRLRVSTEKGLNHRTIGRPRDMFGLRKKLDLAGRDLISKCGRGTWTLVLLFGLDMNPAFELLALPPPGPRIVRIERRRRARLASDAGVAHLVQRQQRNAVFLRVLPHLFRRPG